MAGLARLVLSVTVFLTLLTVFVVVVVATLQAFDREFEQRLTAARRVLFVRVRRPIN